MKIQSARVAGVADLSAEGLVFFIFIGWLLSWDWIMDERVPRRCHRSAAVHGHYWATRA